MRNSITIVDDCDELRFLFVLLLERELSVPVVSVSSLADAVARNEEVLQSKLTILDINLGAGQPDGVEFYQWLLGQQYQGQVYFLTGHAKESPQVQEAARTGVPILEKPMTPDELLPMIKESLRRGRACA